MCLCYFSFCVVAPACYVFMHSIGNRLYRTPSIIVSVKAEFKAVDFKG